MDQKQITFTEAVEGYFIAGNARRLSPHTLADYDNTFRKFETFLGGDPPLGRITAVDIRDLLCCLHGLSAKTLLKHHSIGPNAPHKIPDSFLIER